MAYVSQEMKKQLAPAIKAVLKKYKMKASISVRNHSTLCVNIKSGALDLYKDSPNDDNTFHYQINPYWCESQFAKKSAKFFAELISAMKGDMWYDNTDAMIDYFDTAYYTDINAGSWNKKYEVTV